MSMTPEQRRAKFVAKSAASTHPHLHQKQTATDLDARRAALIAKWAVSTSTSSRTTEISVGAPSRTIVVRPKVTEVQLRNSNASNISSARQIQPPASRQTTREVVRNPSRTIVIRTRTIEVQPYNSTTRTAVVAKRTPCQHEAAQTGRYGRDSQVVHRHPLNSQAPNVGSMVQLIYKQSFVKETHSKYHTAVFGINGYATTLKRLAPSFNPFPATEVSIAFWMVWAALYIAVGTLQGYVSGVKSYHTDHDLPWRATTSLTKRIYRGLARTYGIAVRKLKESVTPETLSALVDLLDFNLHDDRVYFTACCFGTFMCLRGGEFLWDYNKRRPKLLTVDKVIFNDDKSSAHLHLSDTKTLWMVKNFTTLIPALQPGDPRCPLTNVIRMLDMSISTIPAPSAERALFMLADKTILSVGYMIDRTDTLMRQADLRGPWPLVAASWRSGGVLGAMRGGIQDAFVNVLGRFAPGSNAPSSYLCSTDSDAQFIAQEMARVGQRPTSISSPTTIKRKAPSSPTSQVRERGGGGGFYWECLRGPPT
jgi:hypothetical protein